MHHLLDAAGRRPFPPKLRLIAHWNLRDEIKAQYADGADGLARQRMIQQVLERIVDQIDPAGGDRQPAGGLGPREQRRCRRSPVNDLGEPAAADFKPAAAAEPDTRYAMLLAVFRANKRVDPYSPLTPTLMARRFEEDRQMSEAAGRGDAASRCSPRRSSPRSAG